MVRAPSQRSVGRPREFDEEAALEAAMDAFWRHGYEATSLSDLCSCTGLHKGSLYQAFGDKHALFMRALQQYAEKSFREVAACAFESDSPLENIRSVVHKVCSQATEDQGCMVVNAMVELAPHDAKVKQLIQAGTERRLRAMTELIQKAQDAGEIKATQTAEKLARQLMITMAGVAATVKGVFKPEQALETVDDMIDSWT